MLCPLTGQIEADVASFLGTARAALNGVNLPPDLQDFVRNVRLTDFGVDERGPSEQAATAAQQPPDGNAPCKVDMQVPP